MSPLDRRRWLQVTGASLAGAALSGSLPDPRLDPSASGGPGDAGGPGASRAGAREGTPPAAGEAVGRPRDLSDPGHPPNLRTHGQEGRASAAEGAEARTAPPSGEANTPPDHPLAQALDLLLDEMAGRRGIGCAIMGAATGDGSFRWVGARGEASPGGPAMTPETPFFTASITKLFIASAVMRLVEEGELALHHRVTEHLPPARIRGLHVWEGVDRTGHITVEQLLAHASGLPDFIEDYPVRGSEDPRTLVQILLEEGDRPWTLDDTVERVREKLVPHFLPQPLGAQGATARGGRGLQAILSRRGPRIRYSDTGYQLLMGIVEERTGLPFPEALEALVLGPLALDATWVPGHPRPGTPAIPTAALRAGDEVLALPRFFQGIGDLDSTASDLLRFAMALEQGELFRDPATWRRMTGSWHRFGHPLDRAALRQPSWPIEYGLGVMRFQLPPLFTRFQRLPPVRGHTGSTGSWLFHAPALDLYLVGAVSQVEAGALPYRFVPRILREAVEQLPVERI